jgi:hypothetical protein
LKWQYIENKISTLDIKSVKIVMVTFIPSWQGPFKFSYKSI